MVYFANGFSKDFYFHLFARYSISLLARSNNLQKKRKPCVPDALYRVYASFDIRVAESTIESTIPRSFTSGSIRMLLFVSSTSKFFVLKFVKIRKFCCFFSATFVYVYASRMSVVCTFEKHEFWMNNKKWKPFVYTTAIPFDYLCQNCVEYQYYIFFVVIQHRQRNAYLVAAPIRTKRLLTRWKKFSSSNRVRGIRTQKERIAPNFLRIYDIDFERVLFRKSKTYH